MKACSRQEQVIQAVHAGALLQGCATELWEHIEQCESCSGEVRIHSAFLVSRETAMLKTPQQSPELLLWKAQLRRRQRALERMERPALTIIGVTFSASVILLFAVLVVSTEHVSLPHLGTAASPLLGGMWTLGCFAILLVGFGTLAVLVSLGLLEGRS